ncbi:MAG TPA: IPT/TIG domain-containing protein, partial [Blastocatellia bacterium]|nr:IPT/TIG domain-containing protein [Blastocatellia bacterium]
MKANLAKSCLKFAALFIALLALAAGWKSSQASPAQAREVRVVSTSAPAGQTVNVAIELVSLGNENAIGFSLNFPAAALSNPTAALGSGAAGAMLNTNASQAANGRLGVALALSSGQTFAAGTRQIVVITFTVAANAAAGPAAITFGDQPIAREISDVTANTLTANFTAGSVTVQQPNPVPALTSLSPNSATSGTNGLTLTVNGSNFVPTSQVFWNGSGRTTSFISATQLTATIPAGDLTTAGSATVTVTNPAPGGGTSNGLTFTINNPSPSITSLNPNAATAGGAAFTLTVNGSGFINGSTVQWNGNARTTTFVSATQLTASIPATDIATAGTANVTVTTPAPGGGTSAAATFAINNPLPTLTSLSPNSATAGGAAFTLTVNGSGFVGTSTVWWNGSLRTTTFVSATQLTAAIPASDIATAGTASVTVNSPAPGGGSASPLTFTINNPLPSITSLNPNGATAGGAAFTLTVNGSNFVSGSTVQWNGNTRTTTFVSATQLTAAIPATDIANTGTATVTVVTPAPGGGTSNSAGFNISQAQNPAPTLTNINPTSTTAGGTAFTLTVNGTNFINSSTVQWNGNARTTTFVSATQLTAAIPASDIAAAGTANVTVNNPAPGGGTSTAAIFTINNPLPTLTSLNPNSATAGGSAFTLTVNGSNFVNTSTVWWNGNLRTTTFVSATQLTAAIPASDIATAGTASVTVNNPAPGGGSATNLTFTINNPTPVITTLSPNSATAGGAAFTLTVNGSGFINGSTVQWNGNARTTTFVSATQLTAAIPATDIANTGNANVTVVTAAPGGGTSNSASFTINQQQNPVPAITTISPTSATAGGA